MSPPRRSLLQNNGPDSVAGEGYGHAEGQGVARPLGGHALRVESFRTYLLERRAPLPAAARDSIERVVFARNWGPRLRDRLTAGDWNQRAALCDADAPTCVLDDPDDYGLYPISVVVARR